MIKSSILYLFLFISAFSYGQTNIKQAFKKHALQGSITIYNQNKRTWLYSDSLDAVREMVPGSTFNILNSSIGLETGVIKTEKEMITWTGGKSDLQMAFQSDLPPYFESLAKKTDRKDYTEFLKAVNYGNHQVPGTGNDFWSKGPLKISPVGQINFLRFFLREQLPFSPRTFRIVKELMVDPKASAYMLLQQLAAVTAEGKNYVWYIGAVKTKDNAFYFATRLVRPVNKTKDSFDSTIKTMTLDILKQIKLIN
ncbi:class D beta-lactamase [Pedobacter metabolipauper]|uniref:Beta-lactamase class D n=1 Tax=Pedobacter metabolipauper TaxID=425513 RepID=A0A4R6T2D7_9SPHI|nr:class D beta-lactamase [Pedobacter metabolipauper]TDQ11501.1 beta-lactamase class D [Pedobacter metabolipauper]